MSTVAQMYADLRADVGQDKTASAEQASEQTAEQGVVMDADYFNKLASGEEAHVAHLEGIVKEAAEAGYTEEQINDSIAELATDAGVDLDELFDAAEVAGVGTEKVAEDGEDGEALEGEIVDEFEMQKIASFNEGGNRAIEDIFETNDLIKEGEVTPEDLAEYYLGQSYGQGYYEKRAELEEAIEKIAKAKKKDKLKAYMGGAAGMAGAAGVGERARRVGVIPGTKAHRAAQAAEGVRKAEGLGKGPGAFRRMLGMAAKAK
jgi:hypothetical protein